MNQREFEDLQHAMDTLQHEVAVSAQQYLYTPHISVYPQEDDAFTVIGGGQCIHKLDEKNQARIEKWLANVLRRDFEEKGIFEIKEMSIAGDIDMNIVGIRMAVKKV